MISRVLKLGAAALIALALALPAFIGGAADADTPKNGVVMVKSKYGMDETIARMKKDIADKGITFFAEIEQSKLANAAGLKLRPTTLLIFGNPGLGGTFISADQAAGLDWPVRLLVLENDKGEVWTAWTDFEWIKNRHGITSRDKEFAMATSVVQSITSTIR